MSVNWPKFYRWLDSKVVRLPDEAPGEPVDTGEISSLLLSVQRNRQEIEERLRYLDRKLGSLRRDVVILTERKRIEKIQAHRRDDVSGAATRAARDTLAEDAAMQTSASLALAQASIKEYEAAAQAAERTVRSMQAAKETLNALRRMALADGGDEFRPGYQ